MLGKSEFSTAPRINRQRSAVEALQHLKSKLALQRRRSLPPSDDKVRLKADERKVNANLRHAQSILLSRVRVRYSQANRSRADEIDCSHADSAQPQTIVTAPTSKSSQKCTLIELTISDLRLNLMWTRKQHFIEGHHAEQLANQKFALMCVAIATVNGNRHQRSANTSKSKLSSNGVRDRLNAEQETNTPPRRVRVVSSEVINNVDWSATDVVFKTPLRFAFRRYQNGDDVSSVSDGVRQDAKLKQVSIRLEFYATPYADNDAAEFERDGDFRTNMTRQHSLHVPIQIGPQFRLIASATLPMAELLHKYNQSNSRQRCIAARRDTSVTIASVLERTNIALELGHASASRWQSRNGRLPASFSTAMRRISESMHSVVQSSSGVSHIGSDEPPFRIPLFGAFTLNLRVSVFDLLVSFV